MKAGGGMAKAGEFGSRARDAECRQKVAMRNVNVLPFPVVPLGGLPAC